MSETKNVIVYYRRRNPRVREIAAALCRNVKYELPFIGAFCAEVPEDRAAVLKRSPGVVLLREDTRVAKLPVGSMHEVPEDGSAGSSFRRRVSEAAQSAAGIAERAAEKREKPETGAALAVDAELTGEGVCIAIIDTGLSPHYDVIRPVNRIAGFHDFLHNAITPYDDDGHGTHVTGIAAGNGYVSGEGHKGAAPKARVLALKALDETGSGMTSDILAAMQWIADQHQKYNIRVVNLSLGVVSDSTDPFDPLVLAAGALVNQGISVVCAAGNSGPAPMSVTSPGISPLVITVGCADKSMRRVAEFSSRGRGKPDLVAPGVDIISLDAATHKRYLSQTGTSMSAPFVAGLAACLHGAYPKLTPAQVKRILLSAAVPLEKGTPAEQGFGLITGL